MFEYSIRDFFECQNIVEACWFSAFFTQFCMVFECQKFRHAEFLMLELALWCLSTQSVIFFETRNIVYLSVAGVSCELSDGRLVFDCGFGCFDVFVSCAR